MTDFIKVDSDIDYEHLDDLPIFEHIESQFFNSDEAQPYSYDQPDEWLNS